MLRSQLGLMSLLLCCDLCAGALAFCLLDAIALLRHRSRQPDCTCHRSRSNPSHLDSCAPLPPRRSSSYASSFAICRLAASSSARLRTANKGCARRAT